VIIAAIAAAKAITVAAVLKAISDESLPYGPIACAVAAERTNTANMR
jgi:hypothetical protein